MRRVSDAFDPHDVRAGPLHARSTAAGTLQIGWDEPDWLGAASFSWVCSVTSWAGDPSAAFILYFRDRTRSSNSELSSSQ